MWHLGTVTSVRTNHFILGARNSKIEKQRQAGVLPYATATKVVADRLSSFSLYEFAELIDSTI